VAIVLGFIALAQIKRSGGMQKGRGFALAGIIIAAALIGLVILGFTVGHHVQCNNGTCTNTN
jgi:hypothetical protein